VICSGQATGAHTGAGGQCADAIEAAVGADEPACIHMGTGNERLGGMKGWEEREGRLSSNFQGSFRVPQRWF